MYESFTTKLINLKLLNSPLQALGVEVGLFGGQLVLCCLKPPDEGAGEAAELEQLLLAGLNGSKPVCGKTDDEEGRRQREENKS